MKVDYSKTFIYKLCCKDPTISQIYIGHSTDFKSRNQDHKSCCHNINSKKYNQYNYRFIRENGGYDNWIMIKLYDYPCDNKREAEAKECESMIELNATLNSVKPFTTEEERIEHDKQYKKNWYNENKPKILEKLKNYRENNKELKNIKKKHYENNKVKINEKNKKYYNDNKTKILEKQKVKIKCQFCNCELNKNNLTTHQKTQKCKKFQEFIDLE